MRSPRVLTPLAAALAVAAVASTAAFASPAKTSAEGANLTPVKTYLLRAHDAAQGLHEGVPTDREPLRRARQGRRLRLHEAAGGQARGGRTAAPLREVDLDRGQPALRARRGHRRRDAVARGLRRDHRRGLERQGGPVQRRAVRPEALRRPRAAQAGQSLQPDRGPALGLPPGGHRQGREGRPRTATARSSSARCCRTHVFSPARPTRSCSTPTSSTAPPGPGSRRRQTHSRRWS